jgi:GTP-binding protein
MLVDEITVRLEAGRGGKGAVAFNKTRLNLGPTGGDGGRGGNIYFEGVSDISALQFYSGKPVLRAESGKDGRGQFLDGKSGPDMILKVPTGTTITNIDTGFTKEITKIGERILAAGGGTGGRGNFKFRGPTNTSPRQSEEGTIGDVANYTLSLRLIADVGLIGLPNAGKSSLLNELTRARSKVANYAFTTLEPHLGAYHDLIIADIPGLIEGASEGRGLGFKFLKHVERTKILFHLVCAESDDPVRDYEVVRKELAAYNQALVKKDEKIFLTKSDSVDADTLKKHIAAFKKAKKTAVAISILDEASLQQVRSMLNTIQAAKGTA